jgi:tetratricopeptide (TPR) repeat protein
VALLLVLGGGPNEAFAEFKKRFDAPLARGPSLNDRLFSVSGNGRAESIGLAWDAGRERPFAGHGAGSFEYLWYERRPSSDIIRDAHSLYAETFAELGVVGLSLLALALLVPVAAGVRGRRSRMAPVAAGAYIAWLVDAGLDWHWEMVGVTVPALLAGGVMLLASERRRPRPPLRLVSRLVLTGSVVLTALALVSLVGNQALFAAEEALARNESGKAMHHARRARSLLPWSFEPHLVLGDAAAQRGQRGRALQEYRRAVDMDRQNWVLWLRLGQVARGAERRRAYERVHQLNPRERDLPGQPEGVSP